MYGPKVFYEEVMSLPCVASSLVEDSLCTCLSYIWNLEYIPWDTVIYTWDRFYWDTWCLTLVPSDSIHIPSHVFRIFTFHSIILEFCNISDIPSPRTFPSCFCNVSCWRSNIPVKNRLKLALLRGFSIIWFCPYCQKTVNMFSLKAPFRQMLSTLRLRVRCDCCSILFGFASYKVLCFQAKTSLLVPEISRFGYMAAGKPCVFASREWSVEMMGEWALESSAISDWLLMTMPFAISCTHEI